ncbi:MAG: hypothetical protein IT160_14515 [Bryobacterales bacterium]|nr:hypothetical protein [Bryobacterales bacterium]
MSGPRNERGAILLLTAIGLVVLLTFAALTIDGGLLELEKTRLQTAADAAALAAARDLPGAGDARLMESARASAALNGYDQTSGGPNRVMVYHPPRQGPHAGDPDAVEVVASHAGRTMLMPFGRGQSTLVAARAVGWRAAGGDRVRLGE